MADFPSFEEFRVKAILLTLLDYFSKKIFGSKTRSQLGLTDFWTEGHWLKSWGSESSFLEGPDFWTYHECDNDAEEAEAEGGHEESHVLVLLLRA